MTLYKWKISWLNIISICLLITAGMLFFGGPKPTLIMADETDNDGEEEVEVITWDDYQFCEEKLQEMVLEKEAELATTIEAAFLQNNWNSNIVKDVADTIRAAFDEIYTEKDRIMNEDVKPTGYTNIDITTESTNCSSFIQMRERTMWALTESHNIETAGAKTSFVLVNKLKDINEGLREMNMSFARVYSGYKKFYDLFPGYSP